MYSMIQCNKEYVMRGRAGGIQREPGDIIEQSERAFFNEWSSETSTMSRKLPQRPDPAHLDHRPLHDDLFYTIPESLLAV